MNTSNQTEQKMKNENEKNQIENEKINWQSFRREMKKNRFAVSAIEKSIKNSKKEVK